MIFNWFSKKELSSDIFSGDYLCICVEQYCKQRKKDNTFPPLKLNDKLIWEFFISVRTPWHDYENEKITCRANEYDENGTKINKEKV